MLVSTRKRLKSIYTMKKFTRLFHCLLMFLSLSFSAALPAQSGGDSPLIVVERSTDENGQVTVTQKQLDSRADVLRFLRRLGKSDDQAVDIDLFDAQTGEQLFQDGRLKTDGETLFYFRRAKTGGSEAEGEQERGVDRLNIALYRDIAVADEQEDRPAFLGVFLDDAPGGARISEVIAGSAAATGGLQSGDLLTAFDGQPVGGADAVRRALAVRQPGQSITLSYVRKGQRNEMQFTLGNGAYRRSTTEPCPLFIGVTLHTFYAVESGVCISSVLENTPAATAQLQPGDVITAFDGAPVHSFAEVLRERDRHVPGDNFALTIRRGEQSFNVQCQFPICTPETAGSAYGASPVPAAPGFPYSEAPLELLDYRVFPNPTAGRLQVQFRGQAVPTTVQMLGPDGQILHREVLNAFDGAYQQTIDLSRATPGLYLLQVRQGGSVWSEKVVVVPRA